LAITFYVQLSYRKWPKAGIHGTVRVDHRSVKAMNYIGLQLAGLKLNGRSISAERMMVIGGSAVLKPVVIE
jgi:hypothetical protein